MRARFGILEIPRSVDSALAYARQAEAVGFDLVGMADSQSLFREPFVTLGMVGAATERVMIGTSVTNPITRHPAVKQAAAEALSGAGPAAPLSTDVDRRGRGSRTP